MFYAVHRPGGMRDFEYSAMIRGLRQHNIDFANARRVPEPTNGHHFVYPWEELSQAEAFAEELRGNKDYGPWEVVEVPDDTITVGAYGPIELLLSRNSEGTGFWLTPYSCSLIRKRFPDTRMLRLILLGRYSDDERTPELVGFWDQLVTMLSGLTEAQIEELEGYRVFDMNNKTYLRGASLRIPVGAS